LPETANIFRKMIGLPSVNWEEAKMKYDKPVQTDKATKFREAADDGITPLLPLTSHRAWGDTR
jgi:hypothetical protein